MLGGIRTCMKLPASSKIDASATLPQGHAQPLQLGFAHVSRREPMREEALLFLWGGSRRPRPTWQQSATTVSIGIT